MPNHLVTLPNNSASSLLPLKDNNNYVIANAAVALGNIGDKIAVTLIFALNDEDIMVKSNAALA